MAVTLPTVDDFTETTVLTMIRKVVDYLCSDSGLVAQINNNDITGFTSSYTNNLLKIDATKGDGTTIPVCSLTIQGGSSTGNPYPTGISGTVGADGNITFTVTMSSGSPLTTTINMAYFASADDLSDLQEQVTGLKLTSSGNNMSINGTTANIVNSVTGSVSGGNLTIGVNGINSSPISIPIGASIENIDVTNIPTDFKDGDYLIVTFKEFKVSISPPSDWNTEPNTVAYNQIEPGNNIGASCIIRISSTTTNYPRVSLQVRGSPSTGGNFTGLRIYTVEQVGSITALNNPTTNYNILNLRMYNFNGGGAKFTEFGINRTELSNWIISMTRIRV